MKQNKHTITKVLPGSIAEEMGLEVGDSIIEINQEKITDIFDYQFLMQDTYIEVTVLTKDGQECILEIEKEYEEDLGVEFENGLMDEYRSCQNNCIFCFIDQMPQGMRETLYFKDDDSRLSFLQGNYVTLTNMSDYDIDRIIKYRLEPINISFHTTNPDLRCEMLHNRFAGDALKKAQKLYEAGIQMNGQIVLCKDVNDKEELDRTIQDLVKYIPFLQSVSVVPVGLSKHREGLYELQPFQKKEAQNVIDQIEKWQKKIFAVSQTHFVHASDEWYILAERELPEEGRYDGYLQLENGVGMTRLLLQEFTQALKESLKKKSEVVAGKKTIVTGKLAAIYLRQMMEQFTKYYPTIQIEVKAIENVFFGPNITVSGLLTGQDIIQQLQGNDLGNRVLLPENVLRSGEKIFLDDYTLEKVEKTLQVPIVIVKSSGSSLLEAVLN